MFHVYNLDLAQLGMYYWHVLLQIYTKSSMFVFLVYNYTYIVVKSMSSLKKS
jgi:hypothetical protein